MTEEKQEEQQDELKHYRITYQNEEILIAVRHIEEEE